MAGSVSIISSSSTSDILRGMKSSFKSMDKSSNSLSTGKRSDLSVVANSISRGLTKDESSLTAINTVIARNRAKLGVMDSGLTKMESTLDDMHKALISVQGRNEKHVANIDALMEEYSDLYNRQLEEIQFDREHLLGGLNFDRDMRVGQKMNESYNIEIDALNPIVGNRRIREYFDIANSGGAKALKDFGVGNLAKIVNKIDSNACMPGIPGIINAASSRAAVVAEAIKLKNADAGGKGAEYRNRVYDAIISDFTPGKGAKKDVGNAPIWGSYLIDISEGFIDTITNTISPIFGGGDLSNVVMSVIRGQSAGVDGTRIDTANSSKKLIVDAIDLLHNQGGVIGKAVKDALNDPGNIMGVSTAATNIKVIKIVVRHALGAALEAEIQRSCDNIIDSFYGSHDSGIAKHLSTVVNVAAKAGDVKTTLSDLRSSIETIRLMPNVDKAAGTGQFANNDAFDDLKEIVKAGPVVIERALVAASSVHAAVYGTGDVNEAIEPASDIQLSSRKKINEAEKFIKGLKASVSAKKIEVKGYIDAVDATSDATIKKIRTLSDINSKLSNTDVVKASEEFSSEMQILNMNYGVLSSHVMLSEQSLKQVQETLNSSAS